MTIKNWSASVRARLLNISRATGRPFAELLQVIKSGAKVATHR